jgi:hypothetical protein
MQYQFRVGSGSLRPAAGHGSQGRTAAAMSVGHSRSKNGSAKRIQSHINANGATAPPTWDITTASCTCANQAIAQGYDPVNNTISFNNIVTYCCNSPYYGGCGPNSGNNPCAGPST